jgi:hypothetical protein
MKHILKLEDGRVEPIKDLMKSKKEFALRRVLVDEQMGGAEHLTFGYARFEPKSSYHKNTPTLMPKKSFTSYPAKALAASGMEPKKSKSSPAIRSGCRKAPCTGCTTLLMKRAKFYLFMLHLPWRLPAIKLSSNPLLSAC